MYYTQNIQKQNYLLNILLLLLNKKPNINISIFLLFYLLSMKQHNHFSW